MGYLRRHSALVPTSNTVISLQDCIRARPKIGAHGGLPRRTPRQIHLQRLLDYRTPAYLHIPVAENDQGQKLSKLTGAPGLPPGNINQILIAALDALGQQPPRELEQSPPDDIWSWSIKHWQPLVMAGQRAIPATEGALAWSKNGLS